MAMMSCVIVRVKSVVVPSRMRRHKHQRETLRSMVDSRTSLPAAQTELSMWLFTADRAVTSFVADRSV